MMAPKEKPGCFQGGDSSLRKTPSPPLRPSPACLNAPPALQVLHQLQRKLGEAKLDQARRLERQHHEEQTQLWSQIRGAR